MPDHDDPPEPADEAAPVDEEVDADLDEDVDDGPAPLTRDDLAVTSGDAARRAGPLVLGGVALLLVGFIVGRVTVGEDGTAEDVADTTLPTVTFPSGDQDRSGYWGFGGVTPVIEDAFAGGDAEGLGDADTGEAWQVVTGEWRVEGGAAAARPSPQDAPSVAVIAGGPAERLSEVTLTVVEDGAGLLFRYQGPMNHWSLTASPASGIWTLTRVVDGESTVAAEIPAATADGTTVTVAQRSSELQILVEGIEAIRLTDAALQNAPMSGLVTAPGSDGSARFDRFYVGAMPLP